ncbi:unnamed protein product [Urochloa decumbens]|uniref:Protein WEAK CHLOROPLAST MOVEMENT UNDER BLUE LIGHT 1 n=1 Tax=Urochloa decumbens TaxID=240449 RepID=A0ABC8X4F1_9POAL
MHILPLAPAWACACACACAVLNGQTNLSLIDGGLPARKEEDEYKQGPSCRHLLYIVHLCCGMEEANLQGPSSDASTSPQEQQCMAAQEQQSSSSRASEIAGRFVEVIDPTNKQSHVDTAAPIDSVKGAVTKFGGILDWKEKRKQGQAQDDEVDKVQEEAAEYQKRSSAAQAGSTQALRELGSTTRAADKLRLSLKRSQIEEAQARHDSDLAGRRLRDLQRAGAGETAEAELQAARAEVESLAKVRAAAAAEADAAAARARDAATEARETGRAVEELGGELVALKADMESSHAAHVEAEEKRLRLALALEKDKWQWQMELEDAQQEAKTLRAHLMAACDVEMKAEAASRVLAELLKAADLSPTRMALEKMRRELEDVRASVGRARDEARCFRAAAASMRDELERDKAELAALRRREGLSSATIPYLKDELNRATAELAAAKADKNMAQQQVGEAQREAEEAKAKARSAREEVARAREDAAVAKAAVAAVEARLEAVARETLAATTSEEIAAASAAALVQQLELKPSEAGCVTLTAAEYVEMSRRARETEEAGGRRVMEAVKLIKEAKDAEVRMLERLAKQDRYTEQRRQALEAATLEAEEAEFAKLSADRELRQWLADHDSPRPRAGLAEISVLHDRPGAGSDNPHILSPRGGYMMQHRSSTRQRKATFFPRMVMFLARKRAQSWK